MNQDKDLFEEFEFKPLSSGLGFQKKIEEKKASQHLDSFTEIKKESKPERSQPLNQTTEPVQLFKKNQSSLSTPLARPLVKENSNSVPMQNVPELNLNFKKNKVPDFKETSKVKTTTTQAYVPSSYELTACFVDLMLILATFLLSLIGMIFFTEVDLFANLIQPDQGNLIYVGLSLLFFSITWIYLTVNRVFLGATPGEWVCEQTMGKPEEHHKIPYYAKVILRSTFVICTGWILIPIVSYFLKEDLIGHVFNLELVKKANG